MPESIRTNILEWGSLPPTHPAGPVPVQRVSIDNGTVGVTLLTYGGHLVEVLAPDRDGHRANCVLALGELEPYLDRGSNPWLGSTVGRFANRIGGARFVLDGTEYVLPANEGPNMLHGGPLGWDHSVWRVLDTDGRIVLGLRSADGDAGFPGTVEATTTVTVEGAAVTFTMEATTDAPTPVSIALHPYWNLRGAEFPIVGHSLTVDGDRSVEVGEGLIPTGVLPPVAGTLFDLRAPVVLGDRIGAPELAATRGYDHCIVVGDEVLVEARDVAVLTEPVTGRRLTVSTNLPGLQVYTGGFLGEPFAPHHGICLESEHLPDAPNQPGFPSAILRPGATFRHVHRLTFDTVRPEVG